MFTDTYLTNRVLCLICVWSEVHSIFSSNTGALEESLVSSRKEETRTREMREGSSGGFRLVSKTKLKERGGDLIGNVVYLDKRRRGGGRVLRFSFLRVPLLSPGPGTTVPLRPLVLSPLRGDNSFPDS